MKAQIQTSDQKLINAPLILPFVGRVEFDNDGIALVDDADAAEKVAEVIEHISVVKTKKVAKNEPAPKVEEPIDEEENTSNEEEPEQLDEEEPEQLDEEESDEPSLDDMVSHVKTLTFKELKALAEESYLDDKKKWGKLKSTSKMKEYLIGKLQG